MNHTFDGQNGRNGTSGDEHGKGVEPGQTLVLRVDALAMGGRGVARNVPEAQGRVVFVERGLPGQEVEARVTTVKKRFLEAETIRALTPAPHPAEPFCPHFGVCGGCSWQHLDYAEQLTWKRTFVADSLARVGKVEDADGLVRPVLPSPRTTDFRNKMEFAFGVCAAGTLVAGFHRSGTDEVVDVASCPLQSERANRALALVNAWLADCGIPAWNAAAREGFWRYLVIRSSHRTGRLLVHFITFPNRRWGQTLAKFCEELAQHLGEDGPVDVAHSIRKSRPRIAYGEHMVGAWRGGPEPDAPDTADAQQRSDEPYMADAVGDARFLFGPEAFFQTNTEAADLLYRAVDELAAPTPGQTVWDLYCGCGGIGLALHAADPTRKLQILGVESDTSAVRDARANAESMDADAQYVGSDLLGLLKRNDTRLGSLPDLAVVNPPRGGMHADICAALAGSGIPRIIYVSCNPATLARDLDLMRSNYHLRAVQPVDMFPHSPHVESVALLEAIQA